MADPELVRGEASTLTHWETVHPQPDRAAEMPYAPAVEIREPSVLLFLSGATASPLYHEHPHVPEDHVQPDDIEEQTRRCLASIKSVLDHARDDLEATSSRSRTTSPTCGRRPPCTSCSAEAFGDWRPASTMVCINNLSSPGARIELDMIAVGPAEPA